MEMRVLMKCPECEGPLGYADPEHAEALTATMLLFHGKTYCENRKAKKK